MNSAKQMVFAKQLSFLIRAGVPIAEALRLMARQTGRSGKVFNSLLKQVSAGVYLHKAMSESSGGFSEFAVNLVRVGEESGSLGDNLEYLAEEIKKRRQLKKKIIGALVYPAFIAFATVGIAVALTTLVFPKVLPVFASIKAGLPKSTLMLMFISRQLTKNGLWILLALAAVIAAGVFSFNIRQVKYFFHRQILRLPVFGPLMKRYYLAGFCRTMGLLLKDSARLNGGLVVASRTCPSLVYKKQFELLSKSTERGEKMSVWVLGRPEFFPAMFGHTLAVGETAGSLSETFLYLAQNYEQEVDDLSKNLSEFIEPVLMIVMGLVVGFVAISIILPIYSITEKLKV